MKNKYQSTMRLIMLYEHLSSGKLIEDYSWFPDELYKTDKPGEQKIVAFYDAYPFVLGELAHVYSEFICCQEAGIIIYKPKPKLEADDSVKDFFGLSHKEFCHLFIPFFQKKEFGGKKLNMYSKPEDVANNIKIFINRALTKRI